MHGKSYLILSGKGGVGKTTMAVNLAAALSTLGKRVTVVDCDLATPNLAFNFKLEHGNCLNDLVKGDCTLNDATYPINENFLVMPSAYSVDRVPSFKSKNYAHVLEALEETNDFVLMDCAPGLGKEVIETMKSADGVLVVTNPSVMAIADAVKAVHVAQRMGTGVEGVIVNRVKNLEGEVPSETILELFEHNVMGWVPEDTAVDYAIAVGKPAVEHTPFSPFAKEVRRTAARLAGVPYKEQAGLFERIRAFFGL